ncbi:MAG: STAS domain-containing protein [Polyangiaceae bacterium]
MSTEPETLEETLAEIARLDAEITKADALLDLLFEHLPHGVCTTSADGVFRTNSRADQLMGSVVQDANDPGSPEEWSKRFGIFHEDGVTPYPNEELPLYRALRDREPARGLLRMRSQKNPEGIYIDVTASPLADGSAMAVFRDITRERNAEQSLIEKNRDLAAREDQNRELIERLRLTLDALSTPVLELGPGILAVPIIGVVDTQRSATMTEKILEEVVRARARFVVVDLTGVAVIDTSTADRLLKLAGALRLLGSECVVSGIRPAVAQTLVAIGVELDTLAPHRDLEHALEYCMSRGA